MPRKSSQPASRLNERLVAARRGRFVGRETELELFRSALLAEEPPFAVLYIFGPGGVGKSTLVREYARQAMEMGRPIVLVDRDVEPSPEGFLLALQTTMGNEESRRNFPLLNWPQKAILIIDTYELVTKLDGWLRETFLPQLPADTIVVIAGRTPPESAWRVDQGWATLTQIISLRNFRPEESQTYLAVRGIPENQHEEILAVTHGHPLALSLVAEVFRQGDRLSAFDLQKEPDIVRVLLERFTQNVPDSEHRQVLEICAHVRVTSEALLAHFLGAEVAYSLFDWLRGLSFIQQGTHGLFPHDLARDVLDADFRWRNPQAYQEMHRRIRLYYEQELQKHGQLSSLSADMIYQHRYNTAVSPFFNWDMLSQVSMEPAVATDYPVILDMLQRHEGDESVKIARYWMKKQPQGFIVFRTAHDQQLAFVVFLMLPTITKADMDADPALTVAQSFIQENGFTVQPNEPINYVRFWMGRKKYQVAETQSLVAMVCSGAWVTQPQMSWTFAAVAEAHHWREMFDQFNFDYTGEADFIVGGHRYGVFIHDWRVETVTHWRSRIENLQLGLMTGGEPKTVASPPILTLSQPGFVEAARQALRDYTRADLLAANPLMRSGLVIEKGGSSPTPQALQQLIMNAAISLTSNPKDEKFYRAIYHTYLKPAVSQEAAAELLDLPFGTYRYHLSKGIEQITNLLWQRELQGNIS